MLALLYSVHNSPPEGFECQMKFVVSPLSSLYSSSFPLPPSAVRAKVIFFTGRSFSLFCSFSPSLAEIDCLFIGVGEECFHKLCFSGVRALQKVATRLGKRTFKKLVCLFVLPGKEPMADASQN